AGKSTIIKAISGVFRHDAGDILLAGEPINFATPHEARENGIETIYQDLALAENLSIGENIAIGRAIYWNARLVIMDEPTAALGVPEQRRVLALVKNLRGQGKGIIFISHNLRDIFEVADEIVVFRRGENAGARRPLETTQDEIVKLMVGG